MAKKVSEEKMRKMLSKYGLEDLDDERDQYAVQQIAREMLGTGFMDAGTRMDFFAKATDKMQVIYQKALIEQNWIIIRQLDKIASLLER